LILAIILRVVKNILREKLARPHLDVCSGAHVHAERGRIDDIARVADALMGHDGEDGVDALTHLRVGMAHQLDMNKYKLRLSKC